MTPLLNWFDDRIGYRGIVKSMLFEPIPGGARWRYVWGSTLIFTFTVQLITGLFLWMCYSPGSATAWESVYYIQNQMTGGWLLRGIHHFTAQAMIVLLALHMLQVIIDGAYRAPREINFWVGLILLQLVLGLSLTGYLLPWDQKGFWATKVATNLMGLVPGVGASLQRVVVGGPDYGNHTLSRFFALHAGLLPFLMIVFIAFHVYVFRRHGIRFKEPRRKGDAYFWVDQVFRDAVACLGVLLVVLVLCMKYGLLHGFNDPSRLGADLGAPADGAEQYSAARPEWYFLFLFQFLKLPFFKGPGEVWGAIWIPGIVMTLLFLMPFIGRARVGHYFNVFLMMVLAIGVVLLTAMARVEDIGHPPVGWRWLSHAGSRTLVGVVFVLLIGVVILGATGVRGKEGRFRFSFITAGALAVVSLIALAVVLAGGGGGTQGPVVVWITRDVPLTLMWVLMLALLVALAMLLTAAFVTTPRNPAGAPASVEDVFDAKAMSHWQRWDARFDLRPRLVLGLVVVATVSVIFISAIRAVGGDGRGKPEFHAAVEQAEHDANRAVALASRGMPASAVELLRNDPLTQGARLFARHCASCHRIDGTNGLEFAPSTPPTAADLKKYGSREWLTGLLDPKRIDTIHYFGGTKLKDGEMVEFVKGKRAEYDATKEANLQKIIKSVSAQADLPAQRAKDIADAAELAEGRELFKAKANNCVRCHRMGDAGEDNHEAPDLTGWASRDWMKAFLRNPGHERFYGSANDRMPAFGEKGLLTDREIEFIVDWLRGDVEGPATTSVAAGPSTRPTTQPATQAAASIR